MEPSPADDLSHVGLQGIPLYASRTWHVAQTPRRHPLELAEEHWRAYWDAWAGGRA